jgi:hypothetical protein
MKQQRTSPMAHDGKTDLSLAGRSQRRPDGMRYRIDSQIDFCHPSRPERNDASHIERRFGGMWLVFQIEREDLTVGMTPARFHHDKRCLRDFNPKGK